MQSPRGLAMRPMRYVVAALAVSLFVSPWGQGALAFEETTIGTGEAKAPAAPMLGLPKAPESAKDLKLTAPEGTASGGTTAGATLHLGQTPGTEVRIPGFGMVGILPKLDFGLELLYGANEQKLLPEDKTNPDDVQLRGTIKHRF